VSVDPFPQLVPIRSSFPRPRVPDVRAATSEAVLAVLSAAGVKKGARVAITAGSRGIDAIAEITRAAVDATRSVGCSPYIVPAMGSHGGATSDGQRALLAHYGITDETMGCPIHDDMDVVPLGAGEHSVEAFIARAAFDAETVLVINRIKPHTDFHGTRESGLAKMVAIGLGKLEGARACHVHVFGIGLGAAIESATSVILKTGKIAGGVAIIENAYHEVARIEPVPAAQILEREIDLLAEARSLMGRLPLDEIDVLLCDRMGKNISGQGLDTKIIGRSPFGYVQGRPWHDGMPVIRRIVVRDLTDETDGNAMGMGLVDIVTTRYLSKVDERSTLINSITAMTTENAKRPHVVDSDREALMLAARMIPPPGPAGLRIVYVRDTLELTTAYVSEACLPHVARRPEIEIIGPPRPLTFDASGNIVSPFVVAS
jgi:hypothetical protein